MEKSVKCTIEVKRLATSATEIFKVCVRYIFPSLFFKT